MAEIVCNRLESTSKGPLILRNGRRVEPVRGDRPGWVVVSPKGVRTYYPSKDHALEAGLRMGPTIG